MPNARKQQIEQARQKEISKHLAIFSNDRIAPSLKVSSKLRLIELNVLNENGVLSHN